MNPWKITARKSYCRNISITGSKALTQCSTTGSDSLSGRLQVQAEKPLLRRHVHTASPVEPRFAYGLRPVEQRIGKRLRPVALAGTPRMHSQRAQFDAATRETVGVYVDVRGHREGIIMQMYGKLIKNAYRIKYCMDSYKNCEKSRTFVRVFR